jgi:hypothetical protein
VLELACVDQFADLYAAFRPRFHDASLS